MLCCIITWSSVIIDPIIYIIANQKYRNAVEELFNNFLHFNSNQSEGILKQIELVGKNQTQSSKIDGNTSRRSTISDNKATSTSSIDMVSSIGRTLWSMWIVVSIYNQKNDKDNLTRLSILTYNGFHHTLLLIFILLNQIPLHAWIM